VSWTPEHRYIERYADLIVNFALGQDDGLPTGQAEGIKPGDVVQIGAPESAKPLYGELCRAVWRAGGNVLADYRPDDDDRLNLSRDFYELASKQQVAFFPEAYSRGLVDQIDHAIQIRSSADPHALRAVDPARVIAHQQARRSLIDWRVAKETEGRFTWTLALYGTEAMAAEARLSIEEYWEQIVLACFLDQPDPKATWREVNSQIHGYRDALNRVPIDRLHVRGDDADLWLTLGEKRRWVGGGGRNIPSFEVFTSPDWRGTEGWIRFTEPLYRYGSLITGIELEFRQGVVSRARAAENEELLLEMLSARNANRVGEFSLTDARLSRITRFMADTLFDENVGGRFGNTHLAVGRALHPAYEGDPQELSQEDWEQLGFNESAIHTDIVSTSDREVTAVLRDGSCRTIYASGRFELD
jgi:aminopeptidase